MPAVTGVSRWSFIAFMTTNDYMYNCPINSQKRKYGAISALIKWIAVYVSETLLLEFESEGLQRNSENISEVTIDNNALMDCVRQYRCIYDKS